MPTSCPSSTPTSLPSGQPTSAPWGQPTQAPTTIRRTVATYKAKSTLLSLSPEQFLNVNVTKSFKNALKTSIAGVSSSNIRITNVTAIEVSASMKFSGKKLQTSGVDVEWELETVLQDVVDTSAHLSVNSMAEEYLSEVEASLSNLEDFHENFKNEAALLSTDAGAIVEGIVVKKTKIFEDVSIVDARTPHPTSIPSRAPTTSLPTSTPTGFYENGYLVRSIESPTPMNTMLMVSFGLIAVAIFIVLPFMLWHKSQALIHNDRLTLAHEIKRFESAKAQISMEDQKKREEIRRNYHERHGKDINVYADCVRTDSHARKDIKLVKSALKTFEVNKQKLKSMNRKKERDRELWVRENADRMKKSCVKFTAPPRLLSRALDLQSEFSDNQSDENEKSDDECANGFRYPKSYADIRNFESPIRLNSVEYDSNPSSDDDLEKGTKIASTPLPSKLQRVVSSSKLDSTTTGDHFTLNTAGRLPRVENRSRYGFKEKFPSSRFRKKENTSRRTSPPSGHLSSECNHDDEESIEAAHEPYPRRTSMAAFKDRVLNFKPKGGNWDVTSPTNSSQPSRPSVQMDVDIGGVGAKPRGIRTLKDSIILHNRRTSLLVNTGESPITSQESNAIQVKEQAPSEFHLITTQNDASRRQVSRTPRTDLSNL